MNTLETYLIAVRPWSFSASMMPVFLGSALAYPTLQAVSILVLLLTCISALCVHAAGNLFNRYVAMKIKNLFLTFNFPAIMITYVVLMFRPIAMTKKKCMIPIILMIEH